MQEDIFKILVLPQNLIILEMPVLEGGRRAVMLFLMNIKWKLCKQIEKKVLIYEIK